jgi:hypothetical protein
MFGAMLIWVGVLLVASGAIAVGLSRSVAAQAAHVLGRPVVPIAQAFDGGPVRIDGAIAAGEQGTLIAPAAAKWLFGFDSACASSGEVEAVTGEAHCG